MKKLKILVVDKDPLLREMCAEMFESRNFDVIQAADGLEGLSSATTKLPNLIFSGIVMPRMDGFAMVEALKKNPVTASIPIIISSPIGREEERTRAFELGVDDFIVRGTTCQDKVIACVKALLGENNVRYMLGFGVSTDETQRLAHDLNVKVGEKGNFECSVCGDPLVLDLELINSEEKKEKTMKAKFICSSCSWEATLDNVDSQN